MDNSTPKPRRRFRILLAASLALNLLFVGLIAGAVWRGASGKGPGQRVAGLQNYAAPYVQALPREDRRAIQKGLRASHPAMGRKARQAIYADMLGALRSTPYDAAAVEAVLQKQAELGASVLRSGQAAWLKAVSDMTPDARRAYADRLEERLKRGPRRKGGPKQ